MTTKPKGENTTAIYLSGGPARQHPTIHALHTPIFLRVVIGPGRAIDVLDERDDAPVHDEAVHVYVLRSKPTEALVCGKRGSWIDRSAWYDHFTGPVSEEDKRDNQRWLHWCRTIGVRDHLPQWARGKELVTK